MIIFKIKFKEPCEIEEFVYIYTACSPTLPSQTTADTFLFVQQNAWQKRLLHRYGDIAFLDATYRTTKYAMPLFFPCVHSNSGYVVAASFVTHSEDSEKVAEALELIKENSGWSPQAFMTDFSEIEMKAISKVFPGMII